MLSAAKHLALLFLGRNAQSEILLPQGGIKMTACRRLFLDGKVQSEILRSAPLRSE
jgi:hypothetical protein